MQGMTMPIAYISKDAHHYHHSLTKECGRLQPRGYPLKFMDDPLQTLMQGMNKKIPNLILTYLKLLKHFG